MFLCAFVHENLKKDNKKNDERKKCKITKNN